MTLEQNKLHHAIATLGLIAATLPLGQALADQFEEAKPSNWHHWRGPDANGVSTTAKPPVQWSPTNNIQWKVPVEGNGSSTPIIWGNKLFILTAINTGEVDPGLPRPEDQPKRSLRYHSSQLLHMNLSCSVSIATPAKSCGVRPQPN